MGIAEKKRETLCGNNLVVKYNLTKLRRALKKTGAYNEEIKELIEDSLLTLKAMKTQGQHMENRMKKVRSALESCGFRRYKNKKVQEKI